MKSKFSVAVVAFCGAVSLSALPASAQRQVEARAASAEALHIGAPQAPSVSGPLTQSAPILAAAASAPEAATVSAVQAEAAMTAVSAAGDGGTLLATQIPAASAADGVESSFGAASAAVGNASGVMDGTVLPEPDATSRSMDEAGGMVWGYRPNSRLALAARNAYLSKEGLVEVAPEELPAWLQSTYRTAGGPAKAYRFDVQGRNVFLVESKQIHIDLDSVALPKMSFVVPVGITQMVRVSMGMRNQWFADGGKNITVSRLGMTGEDSLTRMVRNSVSSVDLTKAERFHAERPRAVRDAMNRDSNLNKIWIVSADFWGRKGPYSNEVLVLGNASGHGKVLAFDTQGDLLAEVWK